MKRTRRSVGIPRPAPVSDLFTEYGAEKQWISIGLVSGSADDSPVEFNRDDGQVYVSVELQPSKVDTRCRVGGGCAGSGEGEYFPFLPGDEVLVALPEGREDCAGVIIARLNNVHDAFPMDSVGGQDPTLNNFAFRRRRTPFVEEFAGPVAFRNALTGALLSLDAKGGVTLSDGEHSALQLSADALTLQGPSDPQNAPRLLLQLNVTEERGLLQVGDAQLLINSSKTGQGSYFTFPTDLTVSLGTSQPAEHVATVEVVLAMLYAFGNALLPVAGGPAALIALAAAVAVGNVPLHPLAVAALTAGLPLAAQTPKPPAGPTGVQLAPGLGAVRFHVG